MIEKSPLKKMSQINCSNIIMKNIITYIFVLMSLVSNAQDIKSDGNNGFILISKAEGMSKSDIYQKVKEWFALNYNSANNVIQLDTQNKIIVKGSANVNMGGSPTKSNHTFSVSIKEGRFKSDYVYTTYEIEGYKDALGINIESSTIPFNLKNINLDISSLPQKKIDSMMLVVKNIYFFEMEKQGVSEKEALKYYTEPTVESFNASYNTYLVLKKSASVIINSLSEYIQKGKSDDDW